MTEPHHHALVQAPIDPVDEDGVAAAVVGTVISVLATALTAWQYGWLSARGLGWWLWTAIVATGVGILFIAYTLHRKRRRLSPAAGIPAPTRDAVATLAPEAADDLSVEQ